MYLNVRVSEWGSECMYVFGMSVTVCVCSMALLVSGAEAQVCV